MSAMTFTEDNCGTYPPSYPQRESLRLQRYNKNCTYAKKIALKSDFFSTEYKVQSTKYRVQSTNHSILTTDYSHPADCKQENHFQVILLFLYINQNASNAIF